MPKVAKSKIEKVDIFVKKYPNEFISTPSGNLFCKLCNTAVKCDKEFHVNAHRNSTKHSCKIPTKDQKQEFIVVDKNSFSDRLIKAFLKSDIPLFKLRNESIRELFLELGHQVPSDTFCRKKVENISQEFLFKIKCLVENNKIILLADEAEIRGDKFFVVQIALLQEPTKIYTVECKYFKNSLKSTDVCQNIDDLLRFFNVKRENFSLFLSDAAPYMCLASKNLKFMYSEMIHITCVSHLLHNCCMRIRMKYQSVDNLISSMRMALLKNNERAEIFENIGLPPDVIISRWGTWMNAVKYYCKHLTNIREKVSKFKKDGKIVENAKTIVLDKSLDMKLTEIHREYMCLVNLLEETEQSEFTISIFMEKIKNISFENDPADIKQYIEKRLSKSDISKIKNNYSTNLSPEEISLLLSAPCSNSSVERSFSRLKKLLTKDRNFNVENVKNYFICLMNEI